MSMKQVTFSELEQPRVLMIALSGIGNFLMASPLVRCLKDANPTVTIDVLVSPRGATDVAAGNPRIRRILSGSAKPRGSEWTRIVAGIRRGQYDVGFVTHPGQLIVSASLLFFGGVRRRIGHRYSWGVLHHAALFLTDGVPLHQHNVLPLTDRTAHDVVQNSRLLEPLGIPVHPEQAAYDFPLGPADHARADAWKNEHGLQTLTLVGIHPGAHADLAYKRWPAERWAELADRIAQHIQATILVFGGPDERALTAEVCARMKAASVPVHEPLRTTAALIASCACFISNDSGLMHVASSQRTPTVGIFGPTDERRTAPWGPSGHVIRAPGTRPTYDISQLRRVRRSAEPDVSLLSLSSDAVFREVSAALSLRALGSARPRPNAA